MRAMSKLRDGLVGAWCPSVSGWGGTMLRDLSGRGNHGTLTNMDPATDWVVSEGKQALDFDGVNDQINISNLTVPHHYTIAFWVVAASLSGISGNRGLFRDASTGLWLNQITGRYWGRHNGIDVADSSTGPVATVGKLENIVRTWDGTQARLFFNGTQHTSVSVTTTTAWSLSVIGAQLNEFWSGNIYDVRLHNRALSDQEIRDLYNGGPGYGLRPERKRRLIQGPTFNASRLRRQSLIGSGVY